MRNTRILLTAAFISGLTLNIARAQALPGPVQGPVVPEAAPTFEIGKDDKLAHIDFGLMPKPISDAAMKLSHFSNRKLMIFYFSAKCSHCQHATPYVKKLAADLAAKGFATIGIAIKFNSEDEVRGYIRDYQFLLPLFQDQDQSFGERYGTGSIPLVFLVNERGEYIRYKSFNADSTPGMIMTEAVKMSPSPAPAKTTAAKPPATNSTSTKAAGAKAPAPAAK